MFNIKGLDPDGNERLIIALSITLPIICCIVAEWLATTPQMRPLPQCWL